MGFSAGKRKSRDDDDCDNENLSSVLPLDELNDDILERVLSWLPTSSFFRVSSVSKRWKSVADSRSFKLACSQIPSRHPWFFMVDHHLSRSIVFDSAENNWKNLNRRGCFLGQNSMPVAASGGLLCFRSVSGSFLVHNPVTGSCRELPLLICQDHRPLHALAMSTRSDDHRCCYKLVMISGEIPKLSFRVYDSSLGSWGDEEIELTRKMDESECGAVSDSNDENGTVYFLSKAGNVVVTNLQRSPSKQYSSVVTVTNGEEIVYFLSCSGTIVSCNLTKRSFTEFPRLLPPFLEYSIDLVECNGNMFVVLLSDFFESASLRVWRLDEKTRHWVQVAIMPPAMSHELYGKKGDINCVGAGDRILVCFNSCEIFRYFVYDFAAEEWNELPRCFKDGEAVDFVSALSFEPRIEASV